VQKLVLMSFLIVSIFVPFVAASEPHPHLALRKAIWWMLAGLLAYVLAVIFVYPRFLG
jgi:predicted membrane channel-forming protein YqfA (hemolysin III family)